MAVLDIVLLVLFIPAIIRGISKGFVEQAFALASIIVSGKLAFSFARRLQGWLESYFAVSPTLLYILAFVLIVVISVLILKLCSSLMVKLIDAMSIGWLNKLLGFFIAILNMALVLGLLFALFNDLNGKFLHLGTNFMDESVIYSWIKTLTDFLFPKIEQLFSAAKTVVA